MEALVVTLAVVTAVASIVLAVVVLLRVTGRRPDVSRRIASTSGFRWLLLGLAAMVVFLLLDIPALLPALVTIGGVAAMVVELRRKDRP
jgi:hypothetical protein